MSELIELISEVRLKGNFDKLEIDFIHTRASGIMQLLNLLDKQEGEVPSDIKSFINKTNGDHFPEISVQQNEVKADFTESDSHEVIPRVHQDNVYEVVNSDISRDTSANTEEIIINKEQEINESGMLEENNEKADTKSCLGDSFLKGKSINDIITDQNKLEFKLSNLPVSSIKSAIGINDRFQYIRELFDNDANKFYDSLEKLDSMNSLKEASDYLRANFKWKKNELSLKFINLVKRRYHYE